MFVGRHLNCRMLKDMRSYFFIFLVLLSGNLAHPSYAEEDPTESENQPTLNSFPAYQLIRPTWAVEILGSFHAFGGQALAPSQAPAQANALNVLIEYQPAFFQSYGVLGIGPSFNLYPISPGTSTPSFFSVKSLGAQIRYQARFFRQQPVVPIVAYSVESLSYQYNVEGSGSVLIQGPTVGLWLLLNILEPTTSHHMYLSTGIVRTYAILEWRNMSGSNGVIPAINGGGSYYFGLRFEF